MRTKTLAEPKDVDWVYGLFPFFLPGCVLVLIGRVARWPVCGSGLVCYLLPGVWACWFACCQLLILYRADAPFPMCIGEVPFVFWFLWEPCFL